MKLAFNPSNSNKNILELIKNNKDIIFDLKGHNIYSRGVEFKGTDTNTWRDIKINNVSIGSNTLDLRNGSNTTLTNTNGVVTINSIWRPVVDNLTSDSTTSSLSANLGRVLAGLINTLSTNISNYYALRDGSNATGRWRGGLACLDVRDTNYTPYDLNMGLELHFFDNNTNNLKDGGDYNGVFSFRQWASGSNWTGGKAHLLSFTDNGNIWHRTSSGDDSWETWKKLAYSTDIPSSLKNPYSLTTFGIVYDGSAAKVIGPSNFISQVTEGTSTITDGTMLITSYASNSGFADTNAVNVPYKRKAIHLWEYIKAKTDSLYTTKSHNHDDRYVRAFGTSNDNIDSDWGLSFKTFDPIPSGTPPELNPNISLLSIGNNFNRRKLLAFTYSNDNIYYRRHVDGSFTNWRRLAFANEIPTSLKNPYALTISLNGTSLGPYDGSAAKNVNITPSSIGAATSDHNHDSSYVKYTQVTKSTADNANATPYLYNVEKEEVISGYYKYWYIFNMGQYSRGNFGTLIAMPYQDSLTDSELFIRSANNGSWRTWRRILHSNNYASILDSRYYTESEVNNLLSNKLNTSDFNWTNLSGKLVAGNEFNIANAGFNGDIWFNYVPINDRNSTAYINSYVFGNGHKGLALVLASGFIKNGSSSSYVLLGDGGHQTISSLSVNHANSAGNADTVDGYHASSFCTNKTICSNDNSIYDLRFNYGQYDKGDFYGTYADEYPYYYGMYFSLALGDNNTGALMFFECPTDNYLGHIAVKTRGAGDWNITYSEWGTLAYLTDNVASATKLQTPRSIWGNSFDGTNDIGGTIIPSATHKYNLGSATYMFEKTYTRYIDTDSGYDLRLCCSGSEVLRLASVDKSVNINYDANISGKTNIASDLKVYNSTNHGCSIVISEFIGKVSNGGSINVIDTNGYAPNRRPLILQYGQGNVGIGTTTPAYKLDVAGDIYSTEYVRSSSGFVKGSSSNAYVLLGGGGHQTISSLSVNHANSANKLNKWFDSRVADLNLLFGDGGLRIFHATSSTTANKCPSDATVLHLAWDNNEGWDSLLAVGSSHNTLYFRGLNNYKWNPWQTVLHDGNSSISGNTIKINNTSLTVANSNHNHDNIYLKLVGGTMLDLSRISVNGDLYIGDVNNNGWLYFQDIASLDGTDYWTISTNGSAEFKDISTRSGINVGGLIYRDGINSSWYEGRDNALLRDTSAIGYHPLWSLKTTDGSWDFGEYTISGWNNIPMLSYITDSDYNSGNNVTTYQIKFPLASGTVALTSDIPNPTNYYWADVKISSTANSMTLPLFYSVKAYLYSLTNANGSESYNLAYLYNNIINMGNNSLVMHINASNILFYTNSTQCIDINTQGHIGIGKTASLSALLTVASITELTTLKLLVDGEFRLQPVCVACGKVIDPISSTNLDVYSSLNITATYTNNHYRINLANLRSSMLSQNNIYAQITPITKYVSYRTEAIKDGSYIYLDVYCNARTSFYFCVWTY